MEIQYLKLMQSTEVVRGEKNEPVKEEDIVALEAKIEKKFPKAYREFLFLGGDSPNMMGNVNIGFYDPGAGDMFGMEVIQENVNKTLIREDLTIEGGEIWAICDLDGGEQFHFFYFNDPDAEDPENPPVYGCYPVFIEEDDPIKKKLADSFSEYIDKKIRTYSK